MNNINNEKTTDNIIFYLDDLKSKINNTKNLSVDDLKKLLLISYNELIKENQDILLKSYLIITLHDFIELENEYLQNKNIYNRIYIERYLDIFADTKYKKLYTSKMKNVNL